MARHTSDSHLCAQRRRKLLWLKERNPHRRIRRIRRLDVDGDEDDEMLFIYLIMQANSEPVAEDWRYNVFCIKVMSGGKLGNLIIDGGNTGNSLY